MFRFEKGSRFSHNFALSMLDIPYAIEIETSYESFVTTCPICDFENTFNRVFDLKEREPIAFKEVACEDCGNPFNINNGRE